MTGPLDVMAEGSWGKIYGGAVLIKMHPTARNFYFKNRADNAYANIYAQNCYFDNINAIDPVCAIKTDSQPGRIEIQSATEVFNVVAVAQYDYFRIPRAGDITYVSDSVGSIYTDRSTAALYRLLVDDGVLSIEAV